jgi:penicillin amidase
VFTLATQNVRIRSNALVSGSSSPVHLDLARSEQAGGDRAEGSNNWAIAPSKSATGRAILANDPHRAYSTPSLRYIAHLSAPGLNVIGAGEPALPGISIGHNGTVGFGLTIFNVDQEDLYVYELNPANPNQYRYRGRWEDLRTISETIVVKGQAPVRTDLVFTRHGPVVYVDSARQRAYAVRTCWLEPGMAPYFGSVSYMRAKDFSEFRRAMLRWGAPTENQVYADVKGNIGWIPGGLAPIRPNWDGLMPVPGDGRYEWAGFLAGDKLPSAYNPSGGYVTTSNEMNLPADYPYRERKLGFEWANGSRHARIDEVLRSLPKASIEDSLRLQNDRLSVPARRLVALLAPLSSQERPARAALELLRGWNAVASADSAQAALMEVWITRHLSRAFVEAALPKNAANAVSSPDIAVMLDRLEAPDGSFVSDPRETAAQGRDRLLLTSLARAYLEVEGLLGVNGKGWQWGALHQLLPEHPLTEAVGRDVRAKLQPGPFPLGGSAFTPNQSMYRASDFRVTQGPSFRMVLDVGNWDNSRAMNFPGQSGDPDDPHYRDLAQMWLAGEYFPMLYSRAEVEKATRRRVELTPAK